MADTDPTSLTLYFVADNLSIDHNRDLLVWARTCDDAIAHWRKNYETEDDPQDFFAVPTDNPTEGPVPWPVIRAQQGA